MEAPPPPPPALRHEQASYLAFFSGCLGTAILAFLLSSLAAVGLALGFSELRDLRAVFEPPSQAAATGATELAFATFVVVGLFGLVVGGVLIALRKVSAGAGIGVGAVAGAALMLAISLAIYFTSPP